jgi:hypothetical protein
VSSNQQGELSSALLSICGVVGEGDEMIKVRIGNTEKDLRNIRESWINEQLNRRRSDGGYTCVQVIIDEPPLNMVLSTPNCPSNGGGRPPNAREQRIFELWEKYKLNSPGFTGGNLKAFLKQIS